MYNLDNLLGGNLILKHGMKVGSSTIILTNNYGTGTITFITKLLEFLCNGTIDIDLTINPEPVVIIGSAPQHKDIILELMLVC